MNRLEMSLQIGFEIKRITGLIREANVDVKINEYKFHIDYHINLILMQ